ncbi:MAG: sulfotransferase family protein [Elusimicrobiota bacterium]
MEDDDFKIDFIGIGAQKAATTWIFSCLKEHPEICPPKVGEEEVKELQYFYQKRPDASNDQDRAKKSKYERHGIKKYKEYFSHCSSGSVKGEFTPDYLFYPEVPELLKKHFPETKLIVCLRDPIQRAYSQYLHEINRTGQSITFEQAIEKESEFIERGMYYQQLKRYYNLFPEENILVLIYENIQDDPQQFIKNIYKFLEIDSNFIPDSVNTRVSVSKFKNTFLGKFIHKGVTPFLKKTKLGWRIHQSSWLRNKFYRFADFYASGTKKDEHEIEGETKKKLKSIFKKDINKLEKLINKDLSHWK